jgi:predicted nucleotidyltransferase
MSRDEVISRLRAHESELKSVGIVRLCLFGSVARGEGSRESDVDLMGDFDRATGLTLFDVAGLELRLADILGARVDLADRRMLKEPVRARAGQDAVLAF